MTYNITTERYATKTDRYATKKECYATAHWNAMPPLSAT